MPGLNIGLSPNAAQTRLDAVLYPEYDKTGKANTLDVDSSMFFNDVPLDSNAFVWEEFSGVPMPEEYAEQEDIRTADVRSGNLTTKTVRKFMQEVPISAEMFADDQVSIKGNTIKDMGVAARERKNQRALLDTFGDAFSGNVNTTPDGQPLASNSHTTLKGYTVDNLETGLASPDNLWTQVQSLANQKNHQGERGGHELRGLAIPFVLYKTMKEIMNSIAIANSAENNLNIFETDFGEVAIKCSSWLNSTYNSYANANTAYLLLSGNHFIQHGMREEMTTDVIEPKYSKQDSWAYRIRYRHLPFIGSWTGVVGTTGAAAS